MDEGVLTALSFASDADRERRDHGEQQLKNYATEAPEFVGVLSNIVLNSEAPGPFRKLAAVVLKQNIPAHWDSGSLKFSPPLVPDEVKGVVRSNLLNTLSDQDHAIGNLAAHCITIIAKYDWPENWPELFDQLNALLDTGNPNSVRGAMRVLTDVITELDDQQMPVVVPVLMPKLHAIITDAEQWDLQTRTRAITALSTLIASAFELTGSNSSKLFKREIVPVLPQWCALLVSLLQTRGHGVDLALHAAAIEAGSVMVRYFSESKKLSKAVAVLVEPVWTLLSEQLPVYIRTVVNEEDFAEPGPDGSPPDFETFAYNAFGFIEEALSSRKLRVVMKSSLSDLLSMGIAFMAMTETQVSNWLRDANQFVVDEADESLSKSVRVSATMLVEHIFSVFAPKTSTSALLAAATENIEQSLSSRGPNNPHWWKQCEAAMLALSLRETHNTVLDVIRSQQVEFDLTTFMNQVLSETAQCSDFPFLVGRSLVLAGRFAEACSEDAVTGMLSIAIDSLTTETPIPVQVGAVKGLNDFCRVLSETNPDAVRPHADRLLSILLPLAKSPAQEVVREVMETLYETVKVDASVSVAYSQQLVTVATAVYLNAHGDPATADAVGDLMSALAEIPEVCSEIIQRAVPTFVSLVQHHQQQEYTGAAEIGLQILLAVVKHCPQEFVQTLLEKAFAPVLQTLLHTDDVELLQTGAEFVRMFVSLHYDQLSAFQHEGSTGLYLVVQFIAYVLSADVAESACAFIGNLITVVILKAGDDLGSYVNDILLAVLNKLHQAQASTVIMSLLFIFARLVNENTRVVLDFLVEQNALQFVMNLWCTHFDSFYGDYDVKVSASALMKILMSGHPALDDVQVQGDIIQEEGIRTRSKSKRDGGAKHTQIPLKCKIFKLLVGEYEEQLLKAERRQQKEADDDDDDDDADVEDDDALAEGEDDDDWEDVDGEGSPTFVSAEEFMSTSDVLDLGVGLGALLGEIEDDEEASDPDVVADPIYHIDLREHLLGALQSVAGDAAGREALVPALNDHEQQVLQRALA